MYLFWFPSWRFVSWLFKWIMYKSQDFSGVITCIKEKMGDKSWSIYILYFYICNFFTCKLILLNNEAISYTSPPKNKIPAIDFILLFTLNIKLQLIFKLTYFFFNKEKNQVLVQNSNMLLYVLYLKRDYSLASAKSGNEDLSHQDLGRDEGKKKGMGVENPRGKFPRRQHELQTCFVTSFL